MSDRLSIYTGPHVGPFNSDDGGCGKCAECDRDADHDGPCDCGHVPPAVPVGVQPASEAATSATDRAVPTRPEPAEEEK